jgi:peptidylprolyl isomerase
MFSITGERRPVKMVTAQQGDRVQIHYMGSSQDGHFFASSYEGKPVEFILGEGRVIPGIEEALLGMSEGESKTVQLSSEKAYGDRLEELVLTVDRDDVPKHEDLVVGQRVQFQRLDGARLEATVQELSDSTITLDANHPLSGKAVAFEIKLVRIV